MSGLLIGNLILWLIIAIIVIVAVKVLGGTVSTKFSSTDSELQ